jgi:hypothetical protein
MKGWASGLVVGLVLGSALAGAAQGTWQSAEEILKKSTDMSEMLRIGYIQGMYDTLMAIGEIRNLAHPPWVDEQTANQNLIDILRKRTTCLHTHTRGTVGEFERWAMGMWQAGVDAGRGGVNAAGVLIDSACK